MSTLQPVTEDLASSDTDSAIPRKTEEEQMSKLQTQDGNKIVENVYLAANPARRILDSGPQE